MDGVGRVVVDWDGSTHALSLAKMEINIILFLTAGMETNFLYTSIIIICSSSNNILVDFIAIIQPQKGSVSRWILGWRYMPHMKKICHSSLPSKTT